uniref:Uncharacterized protein n=1 Tax=Arundo donax TaxID=35708 RepID=A0A0A9CX28_ARUDO
MVIILLPKTENHQFVLTEHQTVHCVLIFHSVSV